MNKKTKEKPRQNVIISINLRNNKIKNNNESKGNRNVQPDVKNQVKINIG